MNGPGPQLASRGRRFAGAVLDWTLIPLTLGIGWIIWYLVVARYGRSPAKQLLGMHVVREDGSVAGLRAMLIRDLVVQYVSFVVIGVVLSGVLDDSVAYAISNSAFGVAALWCVWDANRQCLWDKVMRTRVVEGRA